MFHSLQQAENGQWPHQSQFDSRLREPTHPDKFVPASVTMLYAEERVQCDLLRGIFGNPFRPIGLAACHQTPTIVSLARSAYDERQLPSCELDYHRLAVLADALEETGAPGELVAHLRGPGPHVRGCFSRSIFTSA